MATPGPFHAAALLTSWSLQPLMLVVTICLACWYLLALRSRPGWSPIRVTSFFGGLTLLLWVSCGAPEVYGRSLYWVWVSQCLALLLIVPLPILAGGAPALAVAGAAPGRSRLMARMLDSRVGRGLTSPLVGPALVPVVCVAVLFGSVPGWSMRWSAAGWLVQLSVFLVGALIALPLVVSDIAASSLAIGAALAVGFLELLVDAVPGLVMRLSTHPVSSYFKYRTSAHWLPSPLSDQQRAGAVLWCVAELLDLPFLVLVFRRWIRADARDAAAVDAILDAGAGLSADEADQPWFLTDPRLRDRFNER